MKKSIFVVYLLVIFIFPGFSQKLILNFNPPLEARYSTEFDIQSTIQQTIMGINQTIKVNMFMIMDSHVVESESNYSLIKVQYKKFSIESSNAFVSFSIDSETKDENPANQIFRSLIDKSFFVKFDRSGEVIEINGLDQIISDILKGIDPEDPIYEGYKKTMEESFGVNNLRQNFQQLSVAFPSYEVSTGDSWNFNLNSKTANFDVQMYNVATIKSISPDNVIIQNNSTIISSYTDSMDVQGMRGKIDMVGSSISEIHINPETGLTKSGVVTQEIKGNLIIITKEEESEIKIPMQIYSRIRVKNILY